MTKPQIMSMKLTGGVNMFDDPGDIGDTEFTYAKNLAPTIPGVLSMRPSAVLTGKVNTVGSGATYTQKIVTIIPVTYPDWPVDYLYIYQTLDAGGLPVSTILTGGVLGSTAAWDEYPIPSSTSPYSVLADKNKFYICTGVSDVYVFELNDTKSSYRRGTDLNAGHFLAINSATDVFQQDYVFSPPIVPRVVSNYRNHAVWADFGPGYENALLIAGDSEPLFLCTDEEQPLAANGRFFLAGESNEKIIAMREIQLSSVGTPTQAALLILKENSGWLVTGMPSEPGETFDIQDLTISRFSMECGCASAGTVVQTPYGVVWAGRDDVWLFHTGAVPVRVGTKIRSSIEDAHKMDGQKAWHAIYDAGFYKLAIYSDGGLTPCAEQWWFDLRDEAPTNFKEARWWGPQVYNLATPVHAGVITGTWAMAVLRNREPITLIMSPRYLQDAVYWSDVVAVSLNGNSGHDCDLTYEWADAWTTGHTYTAGSYVSSSGFLFYTTAGGVAGATAPVYNGANLTVSDGTVSWVYKGSSYIDTDIDGATISTYIDCELRTKNFDFGDPMIQKMFGGAEVNLYAGNLQQIQWSVVINEGASVSDTLAVQAFKQDGEIGLFQVGIDRFKRNMNPIIMRPASDTRLFGNDIQLVLTNDPGYLVVADLNQNLVVGANASGGAPVLYYAAPMVAGHYSDFDSFKTMLLAALNASIGTSGSTMTATRERGGALVLTVVTGSTKVVIVAASSTNPSPTTITDTEIYRAATYLGIEKEGLVTATVALPRAASVPLPYKFATRLDMNEIKMRVRAFPRRPT